MRDNQASADQQIVLLTAPTTGGKGECTKAVLKTQPYAVKAVTSTTRAKRAGEVNGVSYHFHDVESFQRKIKEGTHFVEHVRRGDDFYGLEWESLDAVLQSGKLPILDMDLAGAKVIVERFPKTLVIFLMPRDIEQLRGRLLNIRGAGAAEVATRMALAEEEIKQWKQFARVCLISNDGEIETTKQQVIYLIKGYYGGVFAP